MAAGTTYEQTAFRGMRDSPDPTTSTSDLAALLRNMYPQDALIGGGAVGRPGFTLMGIGGGAQGGAGANRSVQACGHWTKLDGTEITWRICGGLLDVYNWATDVWTNVALGGAGVALPLAGRVYWAILNNVLIFQPNDGATKSFTWDGNVTFTSIAASKPAFGQPVIYYAKYAYIVYNDRRTFEWSEENQPTVGYVGGGFNNQWQLGQTSTEQLMRLVATNEALYYWRRGSIGAVRGAVTPTFSSDGVREGVDVSIGTLSPDSFVIHEREIIFLDQYARPTKLTINGGCSPLWRDFRETALRIPRGTLADAIGSDYPGCGVMLIGYRSANQATPGTAVVFALSDDGETIETAVAGQFDGFSFTTLGLAKDAGSVVRMLHGTANGYVYYHANPDESVWNDNNHAADGGVLAIYHDVLGAALGFSTDVQKKFDLLHANLILGTNMHAVQAYYQTPRGTSSVVLSQDIAGAFAYWDVDLWDTGVWPPDAIERKLSYGIKAYGRWCRPGLRHQQLNERFAVTNIKLVGTAISTAPAAP